MRGFLRLVLAFAVRDFKTASSYRLSFIRQTMGMMVTALVFYFIGRLVPLSMAGPLSAYGGNYFAFVIMGIGTAAFVSVSVGSISSWIRQEQYLGVMESLSAAPIAWSVMACAAALVRYAGAALQIGVYLVIGLLLGVSVLPQGIFSAGIILFLSAVVFFLIGLVSAGLTLAFKQGTGGVQMITGNAANLFGSVYFPASLLPAGLSFISYLLPIAYTLSGLRKTLLLGAGIWDIRFEAGVLLAFVLVMGPASVLFLRWSLERSRRDGTLFQI